MHAPGEFLTPVNEKLRPEKNRPELFYDTARVMKYPVLRRTRAGRGAEGGAAA